MPGRSGSANATGLHQPGLNKSAGGAKAGSIADETETQRRLAAAGLSGTRPPSLVAVYRGPGPASLGGPALPSARNAPVINETAMKRKPWGKSETRNPKPEGNPKPEIRRHPSSKSLHAFGFRTSGFRILVSLLLGGCAVGPNFKKPAAPDVDGYTPTPSRRRRA